MIRSWGWSPHERDQCPYKGTPKRPLTPSAVGGPGEKESLAEAPAEPPGGHPAWTCSLQAVGSERLRGRPAAPLWCCSGHPIPAQFPRAGNYVPHLCPLPAAALGADLLPASSQGQPRGQVLRREGRQTAGPLRGRAATPVTASTFPNCRDRGARGNLSAKQQNSHRSPEPERCFQVCGFRRCHFKDRPEGGLSVSREVKLPPFCSCL